MKKTMKTLVGASCGALVLTLVGAMPASAQSLSHLSCTELWLERNQIFQSNGYCFKSKRGKRHFSNAGCVYRSSAAALRAMDGHDRRAVKRVQAEERRRGC